MLIFGHRGAAGYVTENTLESFRHAIEMNVDGIEFDVRVTQDNVPVVIHDETIDRTTGRSGRVLDFRHDELNELLLQDKTQIPTLKQAFETIFDLAADKQINVELKEFAAVEPTCRLLARDPWKQVVSAGQILITSFDHEAIQFVRQMNSDVPVGLLTKGAPLERFWQIAEDVGAQSANIDLGSADREFVETAKRRSMRTMVYTVNSANDAMRMQQLGVDAIFSDFPDRVRSATTN